MDSLPLAIPTVENPDAGLTRIFATVRVPFPPSMNTYWRSFRRGNRIAVILSARAREYRAQVVESVQSQTIAHLTPCVGRLHVRIVLHAPDKRKRDIDNYVKGLLDALTHAQVWGDDSQIDELLVTRGTNAPPHGFASVVVVELFNAGKEQGQPPDSLACRNGKDSRHKP